MSASFYDLLKFAKTGIASPSMTHYDKLKALSMCKAGFPVKTLTGVPPITFQSDGTALTAWSITGNMTQTGTPTPDNPVSPQECGERTVNLLDFTTVQNTTNASATVNSDGLTISGKYYVKFTSVDFTIGNTYTMLWQANTTRGTSAPAWRFHYADNTYSSMPSSGGSLMAEKEVSELLLYVSTAETCVVEFTNIMLNLGGTALPYEPFGYKLTLTLAGTTQNVYLDAPLRKIGTYADKLNADGTVERRVKKVTFDGTEGWTTANGRYVLWLSGYPESAQELIACSHFIGLTPTYRDYLADGYCMRTINQNQFAFNYSAASDVTEFEAFLSTQYSAGHPVEVWYVLATPTTETVAVPTLTPTKGSNTLSVGTTLQPSEVSITGGIK